MAKSISFDNLRKEYRTKDQTFVAVNDVSATIPEGSFTTIVGPSGSGKTTMLRMIAGLEEITSGSVYFGDHDVSDVAPQERNISMVFQNIALFPHMTVAENISYGLKVQGVSKAERTERASEAAELLQILDHLDKKPAELSGGQQQRVALGAGFVTDPDVLLFDEPMSNLDAKLKAELRVEIQRLHREMDATMVYVTHDQTEAMTMSDHVMVLRDGDIEQFDPPSTLFSYPRTEYVAQFIGTPSTNVFTYDVDRSGDDVQLVGQGSMVTVPTSLLGDNIGDSVRIGVRPQHLSLNGGEFSLSLTVDVVELLGIESVVHARTDAGTRVDVVSNEDGVAKLSAGERVNVGFDREHLFLFDKNGETVLFGDRSDPPKPDVNSG